MAFEELVVTAAVAVFGNITVSSIIYTILKKVFEHRKKTNEQEQAIINDNINKCEIRDIKILNIIEKQNEKLDLQNNKINELIEINHKLTVDLEQRDKKLGAIIEISLNETCI